MQSLHGRLLLAATLALAGFLGTAGIALYQAFKESGEAALRERLQGHVYALLAAANENAEGKMSMPAALPDPRFNIPESGLYARVRNADGDYRWQSPSLTGSQSDFLVAQAPGEKAFTHVLMEGLQLEVISFGLAWEDYDGNEVAYTFAVAMDTAPLEKEFEGFKTSLWTWLGGLAVILLLVQAGILRWGLKPVRQVARDLRDIEQGKVEKLHGDYPVELRGLTGNLNSLISTSQANQERFRNRLGDLAHSMKTPLAILRNASEEQSNGEFPALVREQVQRMDDIVQHQLRRAVAAGRSTLGLAVSVSPMIERLARSLKKVYRDKQLDIELVLDPEARFFGDQSDLMEVLGNIMENACKYGDGRLRVSAKTLIADTNRRPGLEIRVEDNGPGIEPERIDEVLQRGKRVDQSKPGQGIGLSVAHEIVEVYGGRLTIEQSDFCGAAFVVRFLMKGAAT